MVVPCNLIVSVILVSYGSFDYEEDGFGEVGYTEEEVVSRIIEYMHSDCRMKEEYLKRTEELLGYHDRNSCAKIYSAIKQSTN